MGIVSRIFPKRPAELRKWYFATNAAGLRDGFHLITAAVVSARLRTSLMPICLLDDREDLAPFQTKLDWLRAAGVILIPRKASLFEIVRERFGAEADIFSGHWLRCDIPLVEQDDRFILYTDTDVVFRDEVARLERGPKYIACAPEFERGNTHYFNSGVMVMNVTALRRHRKGLIACLRAHLATMNPWDDQTIFNSYFHDRWDRLPETWNWKPYWGFDPAARIVHFHGVKPNCARLLLTQPDGSGLDAELLRLFRLNPDGYRRFVSEIDDLAACDPSKLGITDSVL